MSVPAPKPSTHAEWELFVRGHWPAKLPRQSAWYSVLLCVLCILAVCAGGYLAIVSADQALADLAETNKVVQARADVCKPEWPKP